MKIIVEQLETEIPHGVWCNNGGMEEWCPYFEVKKPSFSKHGLIQSFFCSLYDEVEHRLADIFIDVLTERIRMARG